MVSYGNGVSKRSARDCASRYIPTYIIVYGRASRPIALKDGRSFPSFSASRGHHHAFVSVCLPLLILAFVDAA